jgi:hypothetical protein
MENYKNTKIKTVTKETWFGKKEEETVVNSRYLYQDVTRESWIISESSEYDSLLKIQGLGRSCALVHDSSRHPGAIGKPWYVWHQDTKSIRAWKDPNFHETGQFHESELKMVTCGAACGGYETVLEFRPIDKLMVKSVMGIIVEGASDIGILPYLLRHASTYFGRPVYTSENGAQFLYWVRKDKTVEEGFSDSMVTASQVGSADCDTDAAGKTVILEGFWVISSEVGKFEDGQVTGKNPKAQGVYAYIPSVCFTPNQIADCEEDGKWLVADQSGNYNPKPALKMLLDDHQDNLETLITLDGPA